jgi:ribosomal protein S18 acetylase RimI-like enzyme
MNGEAHQQHNGSRSSQYTAAENDNIAAKSNRSSPRGIIYFRGIQPKDREVIQRLHEQWFPVDYKSDFFDGLCNSRVMPGMSEPLYSCVACFKALSDDEFDDLRERQTHGCIKDGAWSFLFGRRKQVMSNEFIQFVEEYGECILWESDDPPSYENTGSDHSNRIDEYEAQSAQQSPLATDVPSYCQLTTEQREQREREKIISFYNKLNSETNNKSLTVNGHNNQTLYLNEGEERIVGCLIGSFLSSSRPAKHASDDRDETAALLVPEPDQYPKIFYIMTLGTVPEFRRLGLGSILVNRVVDMIQTRPECGALYLHVITYNKGGMLHSCFLTTSLEFC